mmetsp:Transcript_3607/g.10383  ORF Transcript_3607/g.10383 Transcript_3607/m.10383 type:complete len:132 (-) Transcript_3607:269-664(-)
MVDFIHAVTSEANSVCEEQKKKVLSVEHIVEGLRRLEFSEYADKVQAAEAPAKRQKLKKLITNLTPEELEKEQQRLFELARQQDALNASTATIRGRSLTNEVAAPASDCGATDAHTSQTPAGNATGSVQLE